MVRFSSYIRSTEYGVEIWDTGISNLPEAHVVIIP
jgi:hypothetical protein